ncbi:ANKRD1 [Branchiostoma lanceolatum]|uniref:ANKRD1 protein n=1 Tax=Branchiostoma lanceolatum TaxID=7740 RepID=A0A8K0EIP7_BRALA|nr:ANKRD1 [Branchiostoma lanceolatum]
MNHGSVARNFLTCGRNAPALSLRRREASPGGLVTSELTGFGSWEVREPYEGLETGKRASVSRRTLELWNAAGEGDTDRVKQLLAQGVNPNAAGGWYGPTALHNAADKGHVGVAELLLKAGAQVDSRDLIEATPLHWAAEEGHVGVAELLLKAGAQVDSWDRVEATPLHKAADKGHVGVAELLLKAGAQVDSRDLNEVTPLHKAASEGHVGVAELLLKAGAQVDSRGWDGKTPKDIAESQIVHLKHFWMDDGHRIPVLDGRKKILELFATGGTLASAQPAVQVSLPEQSATVENVIGTKGKSKSDNERRPLKGDMASGKSGITGDGSVPLEIQLRGPRMQQLYSQACRQGARPVHSTLGLVVGQFRSGKTCVVRRLTGEEAVEDEPITDGIEISPSVMTKTWRKAEEEPDEFKETMAERLVEQQERNKSSTRISSRSQEADEQEKDKNEGRGKCVGGTTSRQTQAIPGDIVMNAKQQLQADIATQQQTQDIPDDVVKKAKQRILGDVTVQQQTHDIPDDVIAKAKQRLQGAETEEQLGTAEHPRLSIWDFGCQATYYGSHQCFFTYRGIYILVMSLLQKLSDPVPKLDYKASADNLVTGRDYLDHWLNSVHTHTLVHGRKLTPVVLVLTHKDMVSESDINKYKKDILDHISGTAAGKHVLPKIFVVDNFNEDVSDFDDLREYLREVAKDQWYMGQEVPMTWLHLKSKLMDKRKEDDPFCPFQDVVDLARGDDVGIADDSHVPDILTFLHDLGDIIFINEPVLRDHVALRPQVMIDVFKTIITVPEYQQDRGTDEEVTEMWRRLENEGILSDRLLAIIWTKADQKREKPFLIRNKSFLKRLMEKYYLLCNTTPIGGFDDTADESEKEEIYFVPSLLAAKPDDSILYPVHMRRCRYPLYVVFDNMFLPSGMFYRLQAICVRRFGLEESHVFTGCGRFPTDDVKQQFVVTKVTHYLKVELLSFVAEDQPVFTQGLPVRKFLSSCLFEIKEKWIPSIQYDWCFGVESDEGAVTPEFHSLSGIGQETATGSSR